VASIPIATPKHIESVLINPSNELPRSIGIWIAAIARTSSKVFFLPKKIYNKREQ
jgi:hypothetical protein